MWFFRFIMLIIFIITIYIISDFITCLFFGGPDVIEKIFKNPKFKKVISIILFFIAVFFLLCIIVAKVSAADEDTVSTVLLDLKQFNTLVSLLALTAVCSVFNAVILLTTRKK